MVELAAAEIGQLDRVSGPACDTLRDRSCGDVIGTLSTDVITASSGMPAFSAAEPNVRDTTRAPLATGSASGGEFLQSPVACGRRAIAAAVGLRRATVD